MNIISDNSNSTVINEYLGNEGKRRSYQSEAELEQELIKVLQDLSYEYLFINSEDKLINNLRTQLEKLNHYIFTDNEWEILLKKIIANPNKGILEKTRIIQEDYIQTITLDDGNKKNIYFLDKDNIYNNYIQVINQYSNEEGKNKNRYDVTLLINGFPLVHIELKRRGVNLREAFNQIKRYQRESFWSGCGLYEYIQIFVISNGTITKYYSNTTRDLHINEKDQKTSNTYEFTSYWADQNNNAIIDLLDFAKTFLSKHTILNIICKYCVFSSEGSLLVMRPYQIVATERIINRIEIAHNYKYYGSKKAGGYIWHTTGSGKTLTSFKTAQLVTKLDYIDKVLFVVDRKDLDYQTMKEYDKFKKGCANSNSSTKILEKQLKDNNSKIIITTIQKLSQFIKKYPDYEVFNKQVVFIFDECHRSQFGNMHKAIITKFKKYYIFGFTGTPIFANNAVCKEGLMLTTEQVFGDKIHTYTIVNAINDNNVLPFRYEYVKTIDIKNNLPDEKVQGIDEESALSDPRRINMIATYIVNNFARKTKNNIKYIHNSLKNIDKIAKNNNIKEEKEPIFVNGFNSIFAVSSINMAKAFYEEFKKITNNHLKIAIIYSYAVNEEISEYFDEENSESTSKLNQSDRDFLDFAIKDYNKMFKTNYDTSNAKFQNYYKDISLRMKNREIDLLIVVNMFLTGFDAKTLNTLWIDKNLEYHGLIQAFSRTNRILNSVKTFGNIISFRNIENELNDALGLFGNNNASGIILIRSYEDYLHGYIEKNKRKKGYLQLIKELKRQYPLNEMIIGEKRQKHFINLFGTILKLRNILTTFDQFINDDTLSPGEEQDYRSIYLELYHEMNNKSKQDKIDISNDVVFEIELIKQIEVNVDYILEMIKKYYESNKKDKELLLKIKKAILSSTDLRSKVDLIEDFINSLDGITDIYEDFDEFINVKKKEELNKIIEEENLHKDKTYKFIEKSFKNGKIEMTGTEISDILPPISRFSRTNERTEKKHRVLDKLNEYFDKYYEITTISEWH